MAHLRERWEGVSLDGKYTLEKWFAGDEGVAFFQASLAPEGRAVVKLVPRPAGGEAGPVDLWHRIRQLRHPNLIALLDLGCAEHCGETVFYAVSESPDETLASAVSHSPLTSTESREVLDTVLDVLRYLHAQGLVVGALDAGQVVAVGDRIKLSIDAVREAETSADYREDVRLLGEFWQQTLISAFPRSQELAAHAADPNPQTRWTLAEIHAALNPPEAVVPVATPPLAVSSPAVNQPTAQFPLPALPEAVRNDPAALPESRGHASEAVPVFRFPRWILAGTAGFLLLIVVLNRPRHADVATGPRAASSPAAREVSPPAILPRNPPATAPSPSPRKGAETWRVIAFTYRTRDAAAKKVEQLNRYHPGLNAGVFSPKSQKGYYLVSLGGRMTREDAVRLQRSAQGKGLPRDVYIQNYSE